MNMLKSALLGLLLLGCMGGVANAACPESLPPNTDAAQIVKTLNDICGGTTASGVGSPTNKGTTIATGGTAQTAVAANSSRKYAVCQNPVSATEDLFIAITGAATTTGASDYADLAPGGSATIPGTAAVSVNAATTGHRFICTEFQ